MYILKFADEEGEIMKIQKKNDAIAILLISCLLFPLSTIVQNILPIPLNRILAVLMFTCSLYILIGKKIRAHFALVSIYIFFEFFYSSIISSNLKVNIEDYIYFVVTIFFFEFLSIPKNLIYCYQYFVKYKKIIFNIFVFADFILIIALFQKSCYMISWGGEQYFQAWSFASHALASAACSILAIIVAYYNKDKFKLIQLIFLFIPIISIYQSGARIFLIPMMLLMFLYIRGKIENKYIRRIIYIVTFVGAIGLILQSNMGNKLYYLLNNPYNADVFSSFTSNRNEIWLTDLKVYAKSTLFYQLFGYGFDFVYTINSMYLGMNIWAHNDLINLLISTGIFGTAIYIIVVFRLLKSTKKSLNKTDHLIFVLYLIIPMVLNGLYPYQHYVAGILFLIIAMGQNFDQVSNVNVLDNEGFYMEKRCFYDEWIQ